jgi:hypothetical protein
MSEGRPTYVGNGLACTLTLSDGTALRATTHCVDRFWERVSSGSMNFADASVRLSRLAAQFGEITEPPDWFPRIEGRYASLGGDCGLILRGDIAVTCISRGGYMSDARRAGRNARKKEKKRRKALKRGR